MVIKRHEEAGAGGRKQRKRAVHSNTQNSLQDKEHGEGTEMCSRMTKGSPLLQEDRTEKSHHTEQNAQSK